jgi:RNA polymerase sigma-70 factor (ECF subfamily)
MAESTREPGQWLAAARGGSKEALGRALESCRRYLLLIAQRQVGPDFQAKGGASDLVQETFLEAQRDFARFQGTTEGELLAWLRQLLFNNLGHFTRRYRATHMRDVAREVAVNSGDSSANPPGGLATDTPSPSSQAMEREQVLALQAALARLPADYCQVLTLRYQEGRSFEEIGQLMNRSPDAARKLWGRAMDRLRCEWERPL